MKNVRLPVVSGCPSKFSNRYLGLFFVQLLIQLVTLFSSGSVEILTPDYFKCHSKNWQLWSILLLDLGIIKSLEDVFDLKFYEVRPPKMDL